MRAIGIEAISYVGTTLLSMILGSHPSCRSVGHIYLFFYPWNEKKNNAQKKCEICALLERDCRLEIIRNVHVNPYDAYDLIHEYIDEIIIDSSSTTPWFKQSKPDKIIWVFRDPVSLASSYKKRGIKLGYMVKAYNKKYRAASGLVIDYRNIPRETEELVGLFRKLGLTFSSEYLEYWKFSNHMIGGNPGVLLNYARHHCPDKVDSVIENISAGNKEYKEYYEKSKGNFRGNIDILTTEEKIYIEKTCKTTYERLKDLQSDSL